MTDQGTARAAPLAGLFRFYLLSLLLVSVPLPFVLALEYLSGGMRTCVAAFFAWMALAVLYWWPLGTLLFRWKRGWITRLLAAYLASLPLYFLCLWLIYPAIGARFHPRDAAIWGIYFSATPWYFVLALLLFLLTRGAKIATRVATWLSCAAFAAGLLAPIVYTARVDRYIWPTAQSARLNIVHARLVDAAANRIVDGKNVDIENGRIVGVVDAAGDSSDWPAVDAGGKYLLPGLIDVHTHMQAPVRGIFAPFDFRFFLDSFFADYAPQRRAYLESGVTSVRDVGGPAAHAYQMRADLLAHRLLDPRFFVVGRLVTAPHGHPVSTIWNAQTSRDGAILASDSASLIAGLEKNFAAGPPDAVKFIYGTIGRPVERLQTHLLEQGIAWTQSKGLISVVHAETTEEVTEAARAGATGIEHVASIEALPDSLVALLVQRKTFVDPTFGELDTAMALRQVDPAKRKSVLEERYRFIRRLHAAGVRLTVGTDAPLVPYGAGLHDELAQYARAGFTPAQVLTFVTANNAAYLGQAGTLGQIAAGFNADLLLVPDNPLRNIEVLRHPTWVMLQGQIVVPRPIH